MTLRDLRTCGSGFWLLVAFMMMGYGKPHLSVLGFGLMIFPGLLIPTGLTTLTHNLLKKHDDYRVAVSVLAVCVSAYQCSNWLAAGIRLVGLA